MSRVIEGTTLGGYRCDEVGCDRVAVYSPCVCIPLVGKSIEVRKPVACFVDVHVCPGHWKDLRISELVTTQAKEQIKAQANDMGGAPDFDRIFLKPITCHSQAYLEFQQATGLVPPDDALAKGYIEPI